LLTILETIIQEHQGLKNVSIRWALKQLNIDQKNLLRVHVEHICSKTKKTEVTRLFSDVTWTHTTPGKTGQHHNNVSTQVTVFWHTTGVIRIDILPMEITVTDLANSSALKKRQRLPQKGTKF
jgi:hypothetical protein